MKRLPAIAIALAFGLLTIAAVYAVLRAYDVGFMVQANPAVVSPSIKIAMFWRLWMGIYLAPVIALGAFEIARRNLARGARMLQIATIVVAVMIAIQGIFLP